MENIRSIAIDDLVIKNFSKEESQVELASYISDGRCHKFELREFKAPTMEEALKKSKDENELPIESKYVWTKSRLYSGHGVTYTAGINSLPVTLFPINGDPFFPYRVLKAAVNKDRTLAAKPEFASFQTPTAVSLPNGKTASEYILVEKKDNGELFSKYLFIEGENWPLQVEWGPRINGNEYATFRLQLQLDFSSPLGYKGYKVEWFSFNTSFLQSLMSHVTSLAKPTLELHDSTQVIMNSLPVLDRAIPEGEFDFWVPKGSKYDLYAAIGSDAISASAQDKDYVIHPE